MSDLKYMMIFMQCAPRVLDRIIQSSRCVGRDVFVDAIRWRFFYPLPFEEAPFAKIGLNNYQEVNRKGAWDLTHGTEIPAMNNQDWTDRWFGPIKPFWATPHQWIAHETEDSVRADIQLHMGLAP